MGKIFLISDLHFGHENMAKHRGFESAQEQDSFIIKCWNEVVNKKDTVFILGDITMEKSTGYSLLNQLNGYKKVILGNHDKPQHVPELLKYVNSVSGMLKYKGYILTHFPIHESELSRFKGNIHGHVHENSLSNKRYLNVSCEVLNYYPLLFEDLRLFK